MGYRLIKLKEAIPRKIAWLLPRKVAYWATIRVTAHGTIGQYGDQVVPELRVLQALERWDKKV